MKNKINYLSDLEKFKRLEFAREITRVCKIYGLKIKVGKIDSCLSHNGHLRWFDYETCLWKDDFKI